MRIKLSQNLVKLARIFERHAPLYIVGGFVRNHFLNFCNTDIDICSALSVEKVFEILDGSEYLVKIKSAKMGTVEIVIGDESYEHTTFRNEIYEKKGAHCPTHVNFVASIVEDASRRDFTVNTIYYKILGGDLIDFYGGVRDIKEKLIKTIETPAYVFENDGLRIMRMIRLACELGFNVDSETFSVAKERLSNLKVISGERKYKELVMMLDSDRKYKDYSPKDGCERAINFMCELGIFKAMFALKGYKLSMSKDDFYFTRNVDRKYRIYAFILDVYNFVIKLKETPLQAFITMVLGSDGLRVSNREQKKFFGIITGFNNRDSKNIRQYVVRNGENLDIILALIKVIDKNKYDTIKSIAKELKQSNVPFSLKEIKVNGNDILKEFPNIDKRKLAYILNQLLFMCIENPKNNNKNTLLNKVKNLIKEG